MHPGSPLPPTQDAFPALWQYQISPAEGATAGRQQIQDLTLHPSWKFPRTRTLLQLHGHVGTQWAAEAQSGLPTLLWGGGTYQDSHTHQSSVSFSSPTADFAGSSQMAPRIELWPPPSQLPPRMCSHPSRLKRSNSSFFWDTTHLC